MSPRFVYSDRYEVDLAGHPFPTEKYRLVRLALLENGSCGPEDFIEPAEPNREDLLLVHTPAYLDDLEHARLTPRTARSELPVTGEVIGAFRLSAAGTALAAGLARQSGTAVHIGGGFHHAFPDHAEGFCYFNDVAIAARIALREGWAEKVLVVDADVHQGNGTASIFRDDPAVYTFSIHQEDNYPPKKRSDRDVGLHDGTDDEEYLSFLRFHLPDLRETVRPDLVIYVAGADPFAEDRLGGLGLTRKGLAERDRMVFDEFAAAGIPTAACLAGGYARNPADTVAIHARTCLEAIRASRRGAKRDEER
ncbi:MAG: histone deacetylase [Candidatus Eisenbacteria bacterium]|nr:histone deacetylase [Candidatus Eisenbacteria bacterium]